MNDKIAEKLAGLADKLGVAVDVLWAALLKQARIEGIYNSCITICITIFAVWFMFKIPKWIKTLNPDNDDADVIKAIFLAIFAVIIVTIAICYWSELPNTISGLFNPEYWALHKLLK